MKTITKDGIELLEFTLTEEELIARTIFDGSLEAHNDLFNVIEGIELYFREFPSSSGYKPLPRLLMSGNIVEEELDNEASSQ